MDEMFIKNRLKKFMDDGKFYNRKEIELILGCKKFPSMADKMLEVALNNKYLRESVVPTNGNKVYMINI